MSEHRPGQEGTRPQGSGGAQEKGGGPTAQADLSPVFRVQRCSGREVGEGPESSPPPRPSPWTHGAAVVSAQGQSGFHFLYYNVQLVLGKSRTEQCFLWDSAHLTLRGLRSRVGGLQAPSPGPAMGQKSPGQAALRPAGLVMCLWASERPTPAGVRAAAQLSFPVHSQNRVHGFCSRKPALTPHGEAEGCWDWAALGEEL